MIPELGQVALILALLVAILQFALPLWGAQRGNAALMAVARPAAYAQLSLVLLAFVLLSVAFARQDFSVLYVANNSNSLLPMHYRITAVWGAHEGSLLLWALVLSLWTGAVARFSRSLPPEVISRVLAVLGLVAIGFISFMLFTSNPFERLLPAAVEGRDLNPLLQDPGFIIHPPMIYMGYVGFSVAFAFAIASMLDGRMDRAWVRWSRPWTNVAWAFQTLGIVLGSWWAYYELGWGGWWFWDPVENGSFMPWLVGTALLHSQAVTEKRGSFRNWTLLLAIAAFSLSLLGTFIVRSGVLTSVHSFAADPARGVFILVFLAIIVGGSLLLYALRTPPANDGKPFAPLSRETLLMINNLLFSAAAAMVLIGTLAPLLFEALNLGRISVGPPFFGLQFGILMAPVVLLMPFGPFTRWQREYANRYLPLLRFALTAAVLALVLAWLLGDAFTLKSYAGVGLSIWIIAGTLRYAWQRLKSTASLNGETAGMLLAHLGLGVFVAGVLLVESLGVERDVALAPGASSEINGYRFEFQGVERVQGPNYRADRGDLRVFDGDREIARLHPEKRAYASGGQIMTEAAIDPALHRDLYVALGERLDARGDGATVETNSWSLRVYVKPFVRLIWLGGLLMMVGGFVAAADRRFRRPRAERPEEPAEAA
ncbi:MAG: heme lyase CcmF/NrfE family subunit [Rhodanobacteraceae bacterium]|nr:heme lyase CcmF/NrfE family subunit [Rhodanobacteraceae bacterium]HPF73542.1 heme lyase CcmF/NrfE family subunit [Xanthomonadaceae bacterium]HRY00013.1 heme lyase CcmF/NrfE family subunit [Xanthomonadaceae bacterium]